MMLRFCLFLALGLLPNLALAAPPAGVGNAPDSCLIRVNATPTSWMIQGYDPFGGSIPEGTFGITFMNEGTDDCRFTPAFELMQPPFGLSTGTGKPVGYALLSMADSQDVTPRAGRSPNRPAQKPVDLGPHESHTLLYKLVADPDDIAEAGIFTQNITVEARDSLFRSLGGTQLVLGLTVLPSARIGLAGAYSMEKGHAVVDLGELREGIAAVPLQLRVNSTGRYELTLASANAGRLRLGQTDWYVPYTMVVGGTSVNLTGERTVAGPTNNGMRRDALPIQFQIGDVADRRAGTYSDVISITVTAR
jgi:hypothetical protein